MFYFTVYIFIQFVRILLIVLEFCMFGRAIMSWFSPDEDNKIARFLYLVTEPFVHPVRQILSRFDFFNNIPMDISFMFTFIIIVMCVTLLNGITVAF